MKLLAQKMNRMAAMLTIILAGFLLNNGAWAQEKVKKQMQISIRPTGSIHGRAGEKLLSNNIEAYENTIPSMLSDRLRNPKFSGPENPQTGLAAEWAPGHACMPGFSCQLIPGMYMSGREAQLIHNYSETSRASISQHGVQVRAGEEFEVEMWARAQHSPVAVSVDLRLAGEKPSPESHAEMIFDLAHWHRRTCRIKTPGNGGSAYFNISISSGSRLVIDQVHLRPVGETHVSQAVLDAIDQVPCPSLRFPGGCASCTYHWEHGIGPVHLRPVCDDPVFKYKIHYDFGTDEYLNLCAAKGIVPFITLNTTTATPEDAAAWAAYIRNYYASRKLVIPAAYFAFGNENMSIHEIGHMTSEMYVAQLREFVPGVRAAYPEAKMAAIGEFHSNGLRQENSKPWRTVVIEQASDLFDMLVVTRYSFAFDRSFDISIERVASTVRDKEADLQLQAQTIRDAGLDCTMGIVEWNYWTRASHNDHAGFFEPNDIRHCLYATGYLNAFCRMGEILEIANYYSLFNTMGMLHVHDGQVSESDLARVFNLFQPALPVEVLELDVDAPVFAENNKKVDANFIRKGDTLYGFLVNFSPDEAARVLLDELGTITEAIGFTADAILQPVTEIHPEFKNTVVTMPPASVVRVTCRN